jgi:rRNA methylases
MRLRARGREMGLSDAATALMDQAVFIPMRGMVQSLNVSVATATPAV